MIKFFRNIRRSLLTRVNTGKYLKYAIGEILLVMVGILLALQVNNWNQNRIDTRRSIGYMEGLVEDVRSDIKQYDANIKSYQTDINNNKQLFLNEGYKLLEIDSIVKLVNIYYMPNKVTRQTYEKIKNAGMAESLGSREVTKAIDDYYNLEVKYFDLILQWDKDYSTKYYDFWFYNDAYEASSTRNYDSKDLPFISNESKRKSDLINLIESTPGRNQLRGAIERHEHALRRTIEIKEYAENLVTMISEEIKNQ